MALYMRFVMTLAFGLAGLGMVLKILLERLFHDWDLFADLGALGKAVWDGKALRLRERPEDIKLEIEKSRQPKLSTRLIDMKREELKEISAVEHRLNLPQQPIVLTPITPPPAPVEPVPS